MKRDCYLIRRPGNDHWDIGYLGIAPMDIREPDQKKPTPIEDQPLRAAWYNRDTNGMICFDAEEPEVRRLPE